MKQRSPTVLSLLGGLLAIYLIAPFVAGLSQVGSADWRSADVASLLSACGVSIASATLATVLVGLCGAPLGYLLSRNKRRSVALVGFLVQLPLALPPLTSGVLLLFLLGYSTPLGRLTGGALTDSFAGIVLAEAFVAAPFLIIATRSAFASVDPALEDVAATLGLRPLAVFLRVSCPVAWRAIAAGLLLAWLRAFGEFGATAMVAYHPYSLPVYTYIAFGGEGLPAMAPVVAPTLLAAVGVMLASSFINTKAWRLGQPLGQSAQPHPSVVATVSAAPAAPASSARRLDFEFQRDLGAFKLDVAWRTTARRLAILGASGSGKSMTLRLIAGLDDASSTKLLLDGRDLSHAPPFARRLAYVPQTYGLFPHLSLSRQISFPEKEMETAGRWIGRLGLSDLLERRPSELSLGQQQRAALARALSRRADIILLDEPFSALDAPLRRRVREELRQLQQEINATTIVVTHDPDEAFLLADELLILERGKVLQSGPADLVFSRPANEVAAGILGADNIGFGTTYDERAIDLGDALRLEVSGPKLSLGRRVGWAVRPERIRVASNGRYKALVIEAKRAHGECLLLIQLGRNTVRAVADLGYSGGDFVEVNIDPGAVQVWPLSTDVERKD